MDALMIIIIVVLVFLIFRKSKPIRKAKQKRSQDSGPAPIAAPGPAQNGYDHTQFLYNEGVPQEQFQSHGQFVSDTYSDSLLLGSSKNIVRDDPNDINPYRFKRPNYDVAVGAGARQVPSDYRDQLSYNDRIQFF